MLHISTGSYQKMNRDQLRKVPITPRGERSHRWLGIQHGELVDTITRALKELFGFVPMEEQYAVSPNGAALIGGFQLGKRLHGSTKDFPGVQPVLMSSNPQEVTAGIGFSHANDSTSSLRVVAGGQVSLCTNGMAVGDEKMARKHTSGLNLFDWILEGLKKFWDKLTNGWKKVEELQENRVNPLDHDNMLLVLGRQKILPWRLVGAMDRVWREATNGHILWLPEGTDSSQWGFRESLWDWYNAVTHLVKKLSPRMQYKSLRKAMILCQSQVHA